MRIRPSSTSRPPAGFSLIELILAIGLSVVLVSLMAWAIDLHLIRLESSRRSVEEAQLARALMRVIADDLRDTALVVEQDLSSLAQDAKENAEFDVDQIDTESSDSDEEAAATTASQRQPIGVYGGPSDLQLDVLRVRQTIAAAEPELPLVASIDGALKTVRYFVDASGLIRQEIGRDDAVWQELQGRTDAWDAARRTLAAEVVGLKFRYASKPSTDGAAQWFDSWDSQELEALPQAIEFVLTLRDELAATDEDDGGAVNRYATASVPTRSYRMTVALTPGVEASLAGDAAAADAAAQQGAGDASGAGGATR
ncbi:hypothetical protein Mal64_05300 [Pseudobythopirellula maris]|uniref:Pseudopilin GspJ n=1 Tax=Pseudobythopirellula maris TaxID=2527991 RepID=A0A5C5ZSD4_9BACT|nr:hypothetical protein [Pseudobythopirellula maris]TWT90146.1 hypothetical protein Mal64_05300 [Pseudobythopirellula maris]